MIPKEKLAEYRVLLGQTLPKMTSKPVTEVNPIRQGVLKENKNQILLVPLDTIAATNIAHKTNPTDKIAILNFASFQHAGGRYLDGSLAQEEALCYCTNLYPELSSFQKTWYDPHKKCLHWGAYENQSLLSHDVTVVAKGVGDLLSPFDFFHIDVLTCAAPNWTSAVRYKKVPIEDMRKATEERIDYVMNIFSSGNYDEVIIGAFGCGVFKNDPTFVAKCFISALNKYQFKHITCAIPDEKSKNYKAFKQVLEGE